MPALVPSGCAWKVQLNEEEAIEEAIEYDKKILVEKAVDNLVEVNCSVLGNYHHQEVSVLEEVMGADEFLSYRDKYLGGSKKTGSKGMASTNRIIPARISKELTEKITNTSKKVFKVLNLSGVCRIDYLINSKDWNKKELNIINELYNRLDNNLSIETCDFIESMGLDEINNIDLKDILNANTDKTYFKNAKYAASLVRDLDKSNGTADSYLSANEVKNLYYSYLNNPKAENRDIMLNILGKLTDKNANGTIKNFKTVSGNVTQELFQEIMKMLDSGTLKAENVNTIKAEIPASDSQSKTVLELLQSITDKQHGNYLDAGAIVNAYNTTTDKTLKAILSVFVNVDNKTNMATGVNSTFNANKSHDTLGMSYVDLNKFFGVANWTTKIPVENLEELIK